MKHVQMGIDTDSIEDDAIRAAVDDMVKGAHRDLTAAAEWVQHESENLSRRMTNIAEQAQKAAAWERFSFGGIATSSSKVEERIARFEQQRDATAAVMHYAVRLGATRMEG